MSASEGLFEDGQLCEAVYALTTLARLALCVSLVFSLEGLIPISPIYFGTRLEAVSCGVNSIPTHR